MIADKLSVKDLKSFKTISKTIDVNDTKHSDEVKVITAADSYFRKKPTQEVKYELSFKRILPNARRGKKLNKPKTKIVNEVIKEGIIPNTKPLLLTFYEIALKFLKGQEGLLRLLVDGKEQLILETEYDEEKNMMWLEMRMSPKIRMYVSKHLLLILGNDIYIPPIVQLSLIYHHMQFYKKLTGVVKPNVSGIVITTNENMEVAHYYRNLYKTMTPEFLENVAALFDREEAHVKNTFRTSDIVVFGPKDSKSFYAVKMDHETYEYFRSNMYPIDEPEFTKS
jgi:hypothetical protein